MLLTLFNSIKLFGHKSRTHKIVFFLKIFFKKIPGKALKIGEVPKIKTKSNFTEINLYTPPIKELRKKVI